MPLLSIPELRTKAQGRYGTKSAATILKEQQDLSALSDHFDIFLSHSYSDALLVLALTETIKAFGFSVYVDWIVDREMNRTKVTRGTARRLKQRMDNCRGLLFARTFKSTSSAWMPWELGYFDGKNGRAAILPIMPSAGTEEYTGTEYLGMYPYVSRDPADEGSEMRLFINETPTKYVELGEWLDGNDPKQH